MSSRQHRARQAGLCVVLLAPAAGLLALSFVSGGFFPDATAAAVMVVLLLLLLRATTAPDPFAGLSAGLSVAASALNAFAIWTLLSGNWSDSSARAVLEYNRVLLYAAVLVLTGLLGRSGVRARVLLYGLTLASVAVSAAALATWLAPDVLPAGGDISRERQGWPTTYWNATGLIAALAIVWSTSLTCSAGERGLVRVLAAGAAVPATAALIFTVSRGAVAVALLGLLIVPLAVRSSATAGGLAAAVPGIGVASLLALGVDGMNTHTPSPGALDDAHRTLVAIAIATVAAAGLRAALTYLDRRLERARLGPGRRARRSIALIAAAALLLGAFALDAPGRVQTAADEFVAPETQSVLGDLPARQRLTRLGNNGRLDQWRVAVDEGFDTHPVRGTGAGTYALLWTRSGASERRVLDAHSLYVEQLSELGVVGLALLLVTLVAIVVALARRLRGPERAAWAGLLAGVVMWVVHAGVDWDWEMPAVSAWVFAAGGLALGAPTAARQARGAPRTVRLAVGIGCLLLAVAPALVWRSQVRVRQAVEALQAGDCLTAQKAALDATAALSARPEPFEVASYCAAASGRPVQAMRAIDAALRRDPGNWELHYASALIRGAAGIDPRPAARAALDRNPSQELTRNAVRAFAVGGPERWRRYALSAPLPIPARAD